MNQVDLFIIAVVVASALSGARRGMINSAGDIITIVVALAVGSVAYPLAAIPIARVFGVGEAVSGPLGYLVVALAMTALVGWGCSALAERFELPRRASRVGGAAFGAVLGMALAGVLIMASGLLPGVAGPVEKSAFGRSIVQVVPRLHEGMESLGVPLPKLVQLPTDYREEITGARRGLQFMRLNFTRLDGATCIHCSSRVEFLGYRFSRGTLMSPKFRCAECGRTSDGCQMYEGFHEIYGQCPIPIAEEGVRFDCGVWPNGWWTVPHGTCPVCGKEGVEAVPASASGSPR